MWHVDYTTPGFEHPAECGACGGEGYRYRPNEGRHVVHPVTEIRCTSCGGTGLEVT